MVKNSMFAQTFSNKLFHLPTVKGRKKEKGNMRLTTIVKGNEMCTGPFGKLWSIPGCLGRPEKTLSFRDPEAGRHCQEEKAKAEPTARALNDWSNQHAEPRGRGGSLWFEAYKELPVY